MAGSVGRKSVAPSADPYSDRSRLGCVSGDSCLLPTASNDKAIATRALWRNALRFSALPSSIGDRKRPAHTGRHGDKSHQYLLPWNENSRASGRAALGLPAASLPERRNLSYIYDSVR